MPWRAQAVGSSRWFASPDERAGVACGGRVAAGARGVRKRAAPLLSRGGIAPLIAVPVAEVPEGMTRWESPPELAAERTARRGMAPSFPARVPVGSRAHPRRTGVCPHRCLA